VSQYARDSITITFKKPGNAGKVSQTFPLELGLTLADVSEYFGVITGVLYDERGELAIVNPTTIIPPGSYTLAKKPSDLSSKVLLEDTPKYNPRDVPNPQEENSDLPYRGKAQQEYSRSSIDSF
jgi:hypothetical protein